MGDNRRVFGGRYREVRELGSGGFARGRGGVFLAEALDPTLSGPDQVAIKVVPETTDRIPYIEKFRDLIRSEAQILEQYSPGLAIIPIFIDYWTEPQSNNLLDHYIVMEYIEGESLFAPNGANPWSSKEIINFLEQLLNGLKDFHNTTGLTHRDIKPQNIIRRNDNTYCIVDVGIAGRSGQTVIPAFSPHFSSDEQIHGGEITFTSDLYSLGATTFYLLTRKYLEPDPSGKQAMEDFSMFRVAFNKHPAIQQADPILRDTILELVAKEPALRPLDAFDALKRLRKRRSGRQVPEPEIKTPENSTLIVEKPETTPVPEQKPPETELGKAAVRIETIGRGRVNSLAWDREGRELVIGTAVGTYFYTPGTASPRFFQATSEPVQQVNVVLEGRAIALATRDKVQIWQREPQSELVQTIEGFSSEPPGLLCSDYMGKSLAVISDSGIVIWRTASSIDRATSIFSPVASLSIDLDTRVTCLSTDGSIFVAHCDGRLLRWRIRDDRFIPLRTLSGASNHIESVALSQDGEVTVAASGNTIWIWQKDLSQPDVATYSGRIGSIAIDSQGRRIVLTTSDSIIIRGWNSEASSQRLSVPGDPILKVCYSPDGKRLAAASLNRVWIWTSNEKPLEIEFSDGIEHVAFTPDGELLFGVGSSLHCWSMPKLDQSALIQRSVLEQAIPTLCCVALSKPKTRVIHAVVATSSQVIRGELRPRRERHDTVATARDVVRTGGDYNWKRLEPAQHYADIRLVAFTTDGQNLFTVTSQKIEKRSFQSGEQIYNLSLDLDRALDVSLAADRQLLAIGTNRSLELWDIPSGELLRPPTPIESISGINAVSLSSDGALVAVGTDEVIEIFRVDDGERITPASGLAREPRAQRLVFDRRGRVLAALWNGSVTLWVVDNSGLHLICEVQAHTEQITDFAFGKTWQFFATASCDGTVSIWRLNDSVMNSWLHTTTLHPSKSGSRQNRSRLPNSEGR